jgi:hypothetical protein
MRLGRHAQHPGRGGLAYAGRFVAGLRHDRGGRFRAFRSVGLGGRIAYSERRRHAQLGPSPAKPGAAPTRTVERAATDVKGTPAWAVILALGLLALAGAAAVVRQAVLGRRAGVAAAGHAPEYPSPSASPSASASASAFAALPAVQSPAPVSADEAPSTPDRWLPAELAAASRPAPPEPAPPESAPSKPAPPESAPSQPSLAPAPTPTPGTGLGPARPAALPARSDGRQLGRLIAVAVTALIGWIVRLLTRRRTGRH